MRNILFLSFGDISNPKNGYHIRCNMLVEKLVREGNIVSIIQFGDKNDEKIYLGSNLITIETKHEKIIHGNDFFSKLIGFNPFSELHFQYQAYKAMNKNKEKILLADNVYVEGCLLLSPFMAVSRINKNVVLDTHCINKDVALKIKKTSSWFIGSIRTFVWHTIENYMCNRSQQIITVSENDKRFIQKHYNINPEVIDVIPNAVSAPSAIKHSKLAKDLRHSLLQNSTYKIVVLFIGDLGAIHNKVAQEYIRNSLAPVTPEILYVMVGNNPNKFVDTENVIFTGFVDSVDPYILAADVCIAPLAIGSGTKTKVLDYIKYDKLVVATEVAMEGIDLNEKVIQIPLHEFEKELNRIAKDL